MEWKKNVEKSRAIRISRQPSPLQVTIDQKQLENVEHFSYLGSMMNYVRGILEIKNTIAMVKATNWTLVKSYTCSKNLDTS
jgi:hypothetical protein